MKDFILITLMGLAILFLMWFKGQEQACQPQVQLEVQEVIQ